MANVIYPEAKDAYGNGELKLIDDTLKVVALTDAYTYNASHTVYDDLTGVVAVSPALASKTLTAGVFDAADTTYTAITGSEIERLVIFQDTGDTSTSRLFYYMDEETGAVAISYTPSGVDLVITWPASGICEL